MKHSSFGADLLLLPYIFEGRCFTIPDYQRGYAWDEKQVIELLKDIDHLMDDGVVQRHYTGTLVLSCPGANKDDYHVVDGQQRLTTLTILLAALAAYIPEDKRASFIELYLRRGEPGSERSVLRLNHDTRAFFEDVVIGTNDSINHPPSLEAHHRLLKARKLINEWLSTRLSKGTSIEVLLESIEKEIGFIVFAPQEDAETGIMFEVINNRGKPLSELEKVKNYLIYCAVKLDAFTLRKEVDSIWSSILHSLNQAGKTSQADEGAFLRYCMVVHFQLNKTDSQYGYDELKKKLQLEEAICSPNGKAQAISSIRGFINFLNSAALWYARLFGQNHNGLQKPLIPVLDQIRGQSQQASIMPLFLALMIKQQGQGDTLVRLLRLLEILNFRVYMARHITARNDTGQADLYWYASSYYHDKLLGTLSEDERRLNRRVIDSEDQALECRLVAFVLWYAPDELFAKSFQLEAGSAEDMFVWSGLRYFLMSYEQSLQPNKTLLIDKITRSRDEGRTADYYSVEHLWATENRNEQGENNRPQDRFEKRRLGNFVLLELRLNIQGYSDNLEDKLPRYLNGGGNNEPPTELEQVRRVGLTAKPILARLASKNRSKGYYLELHKAINDAQEKEYINFALERWSIKNYLCYQKLINQSNE